MPGRTIRPPRSALLSLLNDAREAKARERGGPYTFEQLAADIAARTGKPARAPALYWKVFQGTQKQPEPETLIEMADALSIDHDEILIAAGHAPPTLQEAAAVRRELEQVARQTGVGLMELLAREEAQNERALRELIARWQALTTRVEAWLRGPRP